MDGMIAPQVGRAFCSWQGQGWRMLSPGSQSVPHELSALIAPDEA